MNVGKILNGSGRKDILVENNNNSKKWTIVYAHLRWSENKCSPCWGHSSVGWDSWYPETILKFKRFKWLNHEAMRCKEHAYIRHIKVLVPFPWTKQEIRSGSTVKPHTYRPYTQRAYRGWPDLVPFRLQQVKKVFRWTKKHIPKCTFLSGICSHQSISSHSCNQNENDYLWVCEYWLFFYHLNSMIIHRSLTTLT